MVIVPLDPIPWQSFSIVLGEHKCNISIRQYAESVYCDLESDGEVVFKGRICVDRHEINLYPSVNFSGKLVFVDTKGDEAPQYEGFGDRWFLLYFDEDEQYEF